MSLVGSFLKPAVQQCLRGVHRADAFGAVLEHDGDGDLRVFSRRVTDKGRVVGAGILRCSGFGGDCDRLIAEHAVSRSLGVPGDLAHSVLHGFQVLFVDL